MYPANGDAGRDKARGHSIGVHSESEALINKMAIKSNVFDGLDERETAYVLARSETFSNNEALRKCEFSMGWLRNKDIDDLNKRAESLRKDKAIRAAMILSEAVEEAAKVKAAVLQSRDERVKQAVATEIIDRELGKVLQSTEVTGEVSIEVDDARESIQRKLAAISTSSGEG